MKTVKLETRLSVEEKEALRSRAKSEGLGLSEYVRNWITGSVMTGIENVPPSDVPHETKDLIGEFCSRDFGVQLDDDELRELKQEAEDIAKKVGCKVDFSKKYFYRIEDGKFKILGSWE